MQVSEFIAQLMAIHNPTFVCVVGYTADKTGEIASHRLNIGRKYETARKVTIDRLTAFLAPLKDVENLTYKAATALLASATNNANPETASAQSLAQNEAYRSLGRNVCEHKLTGEIYLNCFAVGKTVIQKGEYKDVKSAALTLEKQRITKELRLPIGQYRKFKVSKISNIRMKGADLIIEVENGHADNVPNDDLLYFE